MLEKVGLGIGMSSLKKLKRNKIPRIFIYIFSLLTFLIALRDYYTHNLYVYKLTSPVIRLLYKLITILGLQQYYSHFLTSYYDYFIEMIRRRDRSVEVVGVEKVNYKLTPPYSTLPN